jgi:WD40 repeat protein
VIGDNLRAYRITVLYGPSGVGKSSVIHAGLVHRLVARDGGRPSPRLIAFSSWSRRDPVAALKDAVGDGTTGSLADALAAWSERANGPLLVVLDQLEELFAYHDSSSAVEEIGAALRRRDRGVHWLLSIREDALAVLDRFHGRVPGLLDHLLRLESLDREAAREAILAPLERWNRVAAAGGEEVEAEPALVEAVLDGVTTGQVSLGAATPVGSGGGIEAPYLQLVLTRLWDEEGRSPNERPRRLRLETLEAQGGAEQIVRSHLDSALDALPPADRDVAAAVFRYLVTPSGTKVAHTPSDLAEYAALPEPRVADVLGRLSAGDVRITRPVGEGRYAIFHDALAAPILDWRAREARARVEAARDRRRRLLRRVALALGILALAAIGCFLALWRLQADRTSEVQRKLIVAEARSAPGVVAVLVGHSGVVESARFDRTGLRVVSAGADRTARVWNARRPQLPPVVLHLGGAALAAAFSPDGKLVAAVDDHGTARVWDWRTGRVLTDLKVSDGGLDDVDFSPDGTRILTAGDDGRARIWDWKAGKVVADIDVDGVVRSASFSADGKLVATASDDGRARVWDWHARRLVASLRATRVGTAYDASFDGSGPLLVTAGQDGTARVWNVRARRQVALLPPLPDGQLQTAEFSPDGRLVVTNGTDGDPVIWDWRAKTRRTLKHPGGALSAEFSPDGRTVVTANDNSLVVLFGAP